MGFFKIRQSLAVAGGSVHVGADANVYRSAANTLKTDDALTVVGTLTGDGGIASGGTVTLTGRLVAPYGTASPTVAANGQVVVYHKDHVTYLGVYSGGTPRYIAFPATTHGTVTVTVGGTP